MSRKAGMPQEAQDLLEVGRKCVVATARAGVGGTTGTTFGVLGEIQEGPRFGVVVFWAEDRKLYDEWEKQAEEVFGPLDDRGR